MTLSPAQQVFMVFYAILYGTSLGSLSSFVPFPWGDIDTRKRLRRIPLSLFVLNILPFVYFLVMFFLLKSQPFCFHNWFQKLFALLVLLSSLGVFAFYRLYHIIFYCDSKRPKPCFWPKYCSEEKGESCADLKDCRREYLGGQIKDCSQYIETQRNTEWDKWNVWGNLIAFLFYLTPFIILLITNHIYNNIVITSLFFLSIFVSIFIVAYCKSEETPNVK